MVFGYDQYGVVQHLRVKLDLLRQSTQGVFRALELIAGEAAINYSYVDADLTAKIQFIHKPGVGQIVLM
ncbi:hypothetical protein AHiyo4_38150 [Arthrobacter sp. Hiyo4]|nr:hypothetical protein AHiyo4_38150 [Arthrobacter sp. Hiyo4]